MSRASVRLIPPHDRVLAQIDIRENGCWVYQGTLTQGYAHVSVWDDDGRCQRRPAHRVVYEAFVGPVPKGLILDHVCHTRDLSCRGGDACPHRSCVNPAHLEPVTNRENVKRGRGFGAINPSKTHCPKGHPYDGDNLYVNPNGWRCCRVCNRETTAASRARAAGSVQGDNE